MESHRIRHVETYVFIPTGYRNALGSSWFGLTSSLVAHLPSRLTTAPAPLLSPFLSTFHRSTNNQQQTPNTKTNQTTTTKQQTRPVCDTLPSTGHPETHKFRDEAQVDVPWSQSSLAAEVRPVAGTPSRARMWTSNMDI